METLLTILHVVVCLFLIGIVLLQHGKGADIGATFGGSSQSLFGSEGPLPLLNKITTAAAIIFMLTSVALAYISSHTGSDSVMSGLTKPQPVQMDKAAPAQNVEKAQSAQKTDAPASAPAAKAVDEATKDTKK
jgi:preprotein translocase subunit SecG